MTDKQQQDEDQPLDPVMEKVRKKMVRLLVISIGIMVVGLMAVLGAIVYKISNPSKSTAAEPVANSSNMVSRIEMDLPDGASVSSASLHGDRMLLNVRLADGAQEYWVVDLASGEVVSRLHVK